jgi:hypothetical protein
MVLLGICYQLHLHPIQTGRDLLDIDIFSNLETISIFYDRFSSRSFL